MGRLIVIEGIDGSGKNTQAQLLVQNLREKGFKVSTISFPDYQSFFGKEIASYLNGEFGGLKALHPKLISMLYAGDRLLSKPKMLQALEDNHYLIADRYISSNACHQSCMLDNEAERNQLIDWIMDLEYNHYQLPKPAATIFLNVPPLFSDELVLKKAAREYTTLKKDLHEGDKQHLIQAHAAYIKLATTQPDWHIVECVEGNELRSIESISIDLLNKVLDI